MPKRTKQQQDAQQQPGATSAAKRRRAVATAAAESTSDSEAPGNSNQPAAGRRRAAAAAAGQAESDVSLEVASEHESDDEYDPPEQGAHVQDASGQQQSWRGVRKMRQVGAWTYRARVSVPQLGGGPSKLTELGCHRTPQAAARVHDAALIALKGRKAASAQLNFPPEEYPEGQAYQRFGPDLHAYLLSLRVPAPLPARPRQHTFVPKTSRQTALERLSNARAAKRAQQGRSSLHQEAIVAVQRSNDLLWSSRRKPCGICPACRQPWRTDLGGCARMAAFAAAGHREERVVQLLAADPAYVEALAAQQQQQQQQQQPQDHQQQQEQQQQQPLSPPATRVRAQRRQQADRQRVSRRQHPADPELHWLQPPAKASRGLNHTRKLQAAAAAGMKQQLRWDKHVFAATLEEEQARGAPPPAAATPAVSGGGGSRSRRSRGSARSGGGGSSAAAAAASPSVSAGTSAEPSPGKVALAVDPSLVNPFSWLSCAAPPKDVIRRQRLPADLAQMATLCREGGLEAPLSTEAAQELLEDEERRQEEGRLCISRWRRQRQQQEADDQDQQLGEEDAADEGSEEEAEARRRPSEGSPSPAPLFGELAGNEDRSPATCQLCGGARHGARGYKGCPVAQMALAVPATQPECPGCADKEQPGCKQCMGAAAGRQGGGALAQPFVRRAPWLDRLPPATSQLMLAAQDFCSAAVSDLGVPAASWQCTPKALLAVALLAEEAAKRHVVARFPSANPGPLPAHS